MRQYILPVAIVAATASSAFAADLPYRKSPPVIAPAVPVFTWTGAYVGLNAGYIDGHDKVLTSPSASLDTPAGRVVAAQLALLGAQSTRLKSSGFTGGGQVGYNYQFTPGSGIVVGVEADAQFVDATRKRVSSYTISRPSAIDPTLTFRDALAFSQKDELSFLGTVRGRIGYAFDRVLIFGTGGLAYGDVKYRGSLNDAYSWSDPTNASIGGYGLITSKSSKIQTGYAYGGGIEYAIPSDSFLNFFKASAVTLKAEYLHYDLGSRKIVGVFSSGGALPRAGSGTVTKLVTEGDIFRAGLNYKFGSY